MSLGVLRCKKGEVVDPSIKSLKHISLPPDQFLRLKKMEEGKQLYNVIEEIINSYEQKVNIVASLISKVVGKINNVHQEQMILADRLKDILAKNRNLRRKDFEDMMADIRIHQIQREKKVAHLLEIFCTEEKESVEQLRKILSSKDSSDLNSFNILKKKMLNRPKERERMLSRMLKNFHREQEDLVAVLRKLIEKGPDVRIKDFKAMIKAFQIEHQDEVRGIDEILEEFERVKDEICSKWQRVMATVSKGDYNVPLAEP